MSKRHFYIAVQNKFNAWATIYCGTCLPKMSKAYAYLEYHLGRYCYKLKLDEDTNYDPDCGAFSTYESVFGKKPELDSELDFDKRLAAIRKEFGKVAD